MINQKLYSNLICLDCGGALKMVKDIKLVCGECSRSYPIKNGAPYIVDKQGRGYYKSNPDSFINQLKVLFKKYPFLFSFFYYAFGSSFVGKSAKEAVDKLGDEKLIINLGSGIKKIRDGVINVDFYPFKQVGLVADISRLPLKNNSVDAVINEFVLEHVKDPKKIVDEIYRVLKPKGVVYVCVPFVASFHSSPDDYYRWSKEGLRQLMSDFEEKDFGVRCGPTSALLSVLNEWLAIIFSFGSRKLEQILLIGLMVITSPVKLFDYLIYKLPNAENIAYGFYYIGRKK